MSSSDISQLALLNEYKGSLFEYLVSLKLAEQLDLSLSFYNSMSENQLSIFEQQESFVRNFFPNLVYELPKLAGTTANKILIDLGTKDIDRIIIVGKSMASNNTESYSEADIVLVGPIKSYNLSLKLAKKQSFVNTKSAGIKSFFSKYFVDFNVDPIQAKLNSLVDNAFEKMAMNMHHEADIEYSNGFENWELENQVVLPGKLPDDLKVFLYQYYSILNNYIYENILKLIELDQEMFVKSCAALIGHSQGDLISVISFYEQKDDLFVKTETLVTKFDTNQKILDVKLRDNSFDIIFETLILQLRIKPMNKFTSKSYKVNCAVKFLTN